MLIHLGGEVERLSDLKGLRIADTQVAPTASNNMPLIQAPIAITSSSGPAVTAAQTTSTVVASTIAHITHPIITNAPASTVAVEPVPSSRNMSSSAAPISLVQSPISLPTSAQGLTMNSAISLYSNTTVEADMIDSPSHTSIDQMDYGFNDDDGGMLETSLIAPPAADDSAHFDDPVQQMWQDEEAVEDPSIEPVASASVTSELTDDVHLLSYFLIPEDDLRTNNIDPQAPVRIQGVFNKLRTFKISRDEYVVKLDMDDSDSVQLVSVASEFVSQLVGYTPQECKNYFADTHITEAERKERKKEVKGRFHAVCGVFIARRVYTPASSSSQDVGEEGGGGVRGAVAELVGYA